MAANLGPRIVKSGLILELDAADINSYVGSGTSWKDLSGNGYNGTLTNGPTFSGTNGGCIVFDGVDDFVTIPLVTTQTTTVSMEIWFNAASLLGNKSLFYNGSGASNGYGFNLGSGGVATTLYVFFGGISLDVVRFANTQTNTWYHAVYTRRTSPSILDSLYINGVSTSTGTTLTPNTPTGSTVITLSTAAFNGKVSVARMYNRTLTAAEVLQNYNAVKARFGV